MTIEEFKQNPKTKYLALQYEELFKSDPESAKYIWDQMEAITEESGKNDLPDEVKELILEVRAGAGGDEAALFARNLAEMYGGYAQRMNWSFLPVDESGSESGGYKEATFEIRGRDNRKTSFSRPRLGGTHHRRDNAGTCKNCSASGKNH